MRKIDISIYDILGHIVYNKTAHDREDIIVNTKGLLKASIYFVTVKAGQLISTTKLIVQ